MNKIHLFTEGLVMAIKSVRSTQSANHILGEGENTKSPLSIALLNLFSGPPPTAKLVDLDYKMLRNIHFTQGAVASLH